MSFISRALNFAFFSFKIAKITRFRALEISKNKVISARDIVSRWYQKRCRDIILSSPPEEDSHAKGVGKGKHPHSGDGTDEGEENVFVASKHLTV